MSDRPPMNRTLDDGRGGRKERGGFNPSRLSDVQRPNPVIPRIVGGGVLPRDNGGPASLIPPGSPAQRALQEERARAEPKGFTEVRIIGVGGGGGNAVNRMIEAGVTGVEFIVANTDPQALDMAQALSKIHLGQASRRLGAGGDPAVGRKAAEESVAEIEEVLAGADMVFITAGMGGGTGTGAAPVIARVAREIGALTVGIVTVPFSFEGSRRRRIADEGIADLRNAVDALIVIPNDRLLGLAERTTSMVDAFRRADDMLRHGVQGIADLVTVTGLINLDFADVRAVMQNAGSALMAIGEGSGDGRALQAAQAVVTSPLLEHSIAGATGILLNVTGGPDLTLHEMTEVAEYVTQAVAENANIIVGAVVHPRPEVELRVTLIATGMPVETPSRDSWRSRAAPSRAAPYGEPLRAEPPAPAARPDRDDRYERRDRDERPAFAEPRPARDPGRGGVQLPDDLDPLDVPPFLRRPR